MNRNYEKLLDEYNRQFFNAPNRSRRGQIDLDDYRRVRNLAEQYTTREGGNLTTFIYNLTDIALRAGIMIGYKAKKAEETEARRTPRTK